MLVVTKADLGEVAVRAQRDLAQALTALGSSGVPVVAVSSLPPVSGIDELVAAIDAHAQALDVPAARARARRLAALADLVAEHGESALRALGGRREAERHLARQAVSAGPADLAAALRAKAGLA